MGVFAHLMFFHFNCLSVFRKQEGWWVCAADPDSHSTKRELVKEPSFCSFHSDLYPSKVCVWFSCSHSQHFWACFRICCTPTLCKIIRDDACGHHHPNLLKILHPLCHTVPGQDAESLPAHRAAYTDLCLLWRMKMTNSFHASIPPAGNAFWWNWPFKFEKCYVSGSTNQPGVSAQSVHLLLALSRTSLAPACFASITIYQVTIKAEGSRFGTAHWARKTAAQSRGWLHWHLLGVRLTGDSALSSPKSLCILLLCIENPCKLLMCNITPVIIIISDDYMEDEGT